jgi:hypothetical protein
MEVVVNNPELTSLPASSGNLTASCAAENDLANAVGAPAAIAKDDCSSSSSNNNNNGKNKNSTDYAKTLSNYRTCNTSSRSNGRPRKPGSTYNFKEENIQAYTDANGIVYKVSEHVYMDINKPNQPFAIACILDFKMVNFLMFGLCKFRPFLGENSTKRNLFLTKKVQNYVEKIKSQK